VTVVLPRRAYPPLAGHVLHDHTGDRIARLVSHVPGAVATIIPFDVMNHSAAAPVSKDPGWPAPVPGTDPIGSLQRGRVTVQGQLRTVQLRPAPQSNILACQITDSTGDLTALFYGRTHIQGLEPGGRIRLHGMAGVGADGRRTMINPSYELIR
jgi:hypothetical protein